MGVLSYMIVIRIYLGVGLLVKQNKTFEDIPLGSDEDESVDQENKYSIMENKPL